MNDQNAALTGVAAGVPFTALPPEGWHDSQEPAPLIIAWHLNDPPRSAAAMAAALPLAAVAAWRVYLDLPMHGRRQLPGGLAEFMQLGYQDACGQEDAVNISMTTVYWPGDVPGTHCTQMPTWGSISSRRWPSLNR
jgi:hypothetical protein